MNQLSDSAAKNLVDFETMRPHIHSRLLSSKYRDLSNMVKECITDTIYQTWYATCETSDDGKTVAQAAVTDRLLEIWNVEIDAVKQAALQNDSNCYRIVQVTGADIDDTNDDIHAMLAVTNADKLNGAIGILDSEIQARLAELYTGGYYAIPSSIHEMLVVPKDHVDPESLASMISEINQACEVLRPEERLADVPFTVESGTLVPAC